LADPTAAQDSNVLRIAHLLNHVQLFRKLANYN
jgi:hypothetical protein